jgi:Mononegavirales RNA dependent RNA polymerase
MRDTLNEVQKKILNASQGQGSESHWCYTNQIDYEKWNNHQRYSSTASVFTVMGKFYGLPRLFKRTHLLFEECFVYFADRVDLLYWDGTKIDNTSDVLSSWYGQKGGLEGLRQKGWTLISTLVIESEGKTRNTQLIVLAQGDNQAITTFYKGNYSLYTDIRQDALNAYNNNQALIENIQSGIDKLGLISNENETVISSEYLNYGKLVTLWGNRLPIETKRYSRATGCTNDQLPGVGPVLSSVGTICLTVAQATESILELITMYTHLGIMSLTLLLQHDPAARIGLRHLVSKLGETEQRAWWIKNLFLDPALGGVGGMSLNRFLIRGFPDTVTESLSFARNVAKHMSDPELIKILTLFGHPKLKKFGHLDMMKLLENPSGLNLKHSLSGPNLIREEIKKNLVSNAHSYENKLFRTSFI